MKSRHAEVGYGPSPLDSSTRRIKQIVLWTDDIRLTARFNLSEAARLHWRDKITVDRWHYIV
jgi:hypothetical protein